PLVHKLVREASLDSLFQDPLLLTRPRSLRSTPVGAGAAQENTDGPRTVVRHSGCAGRSHEEGHRPQPAAATRGFPEAAVGAGKEIIWSAAFSAALVFLSGSSNGRGGTAPPSFWSAAFSAALVFGFL